MKKLNKKGFSVYEIPKLALVLGVIALVIGVMASILTQYNSTPDLVSSSLKADSNTLKLYNSTAVFFGDLDAYGGVPVSCSGATFYNTDATNVTVNVTASGCYATLKDNLLNNTDLEVNYTLGFTTYTAAYNNTRLGLDAQLSLAGWQGTFVVVIAAAIILGIVYMYLLNKT